MLLGERTVQGQRTHVEQMKTGFGSDISQCRSGEEILRISDTAWTAEKVPLYMADGTIVPGSNAIVRKTDRRILSPSASDGYTIFQQEQFLPIMDGLMSLGASPIMGGAFFGGKRVWYQFELPQTDVFGDRHRQYLYLINSHDGSGCVQIMTSLLRIVCSNSINMMVKGASARWSYIHRGDLIGKVEEAQAAILRAEDYKVNYKHQADKLRLTRIDDSVVDHVLEQIIPFPKVKDGEVMSERVKRTTLEKRARIAEIYRSKTDLEDFRGTAYGLFQAVADDLSNPVFMRLGDTTKERYVDQSISGHPLLGKAYNALLVA